MNMLIACKRFMERYGDEEMTLSRPILTIRDNYATALSSGSNGYITKVRVRDSQFEFYHNFWGGGWLTLEDFKKKFPRPYYQLKNLLEKEFMS